MFCLPDDKQVEDTHHQHHDEHPQHTQEKKATDFGGH